MKAFLQYAGTGDPDMRCYSLLRLLRSISGIDPRADTGFEREVSDEVARQLDTKPRGIFVPRCIFSRDLTAGTATDGAELVASDLLSSAFIDALRPSRTVLNYATMLDGLVGNVDIPRKTTASSVNWLAAEDDDATESEAQFDQVSLTPKDLAAYTEITRRLLIQSTPSAEAIVRDDLLKAQIEGLELAVLYGSGSSGQPLGVANQSGIKSFSFAAAGPTYAETVRMVREVMDGSADNGSTSMAYVIDPAGWEDGMTTEKVADTGKFLIDTSTDAINQRPYMVNSQVTAEDWFFGNWRDVLIGLWGGVDILADRATHSLKGKLRLVLYQSADVAVRHPESFCYANDGA